MKELRVSCQVCRSILKAGDFFCASCGAIAPEHSVKTEAAISRLEPALIAMRPAVRRSRGIVSKEGGDGLIALFGAPHADDNDAIMACHAAVELVRRIKLLEDPALQVRVGVHSGYVVAHVIEADFSSIYEAGGPAVHLVKRLESAPRRADKSSCRSPAIICAPDW